MYINYEQGTCIVTIGCGKKKKKKKKDHTADSSVNVKLTYQPMGAKKYI